MIAKYPGTCVLCHRSIDVGDDIVYERGIGAAHSACDESPTTRHDTSDDNLGGTLPSQRSRPRSIP